MRKLNTPFHNKIKNILSSRLSTFTKILTFHSPGGMCTLCGVNHPDLYKYKIVPNINTIKNRLVDE